MDIFAVFSADRLAGKGFAQNRKKKVNHYGYIYRKD